MEWPYRRFLKAFEAFQRRVMCDEWRARKTAHICALHANSNFVDDEKAGVDCASILDKLERSYDTLIARIWNGDKGESEAHQEVWESPFMRAGRRAIDSVSPPTLPGQEQIAALPE